MKSVILFFTLFTGIFELSADGLFEGFEVENQSPFNGSAELTWTGDLSDFDITTSTWPYGSSVEFAGDHSIRCNASVEVNSTIITEIANAYSSELTVRWEVYVSGNSADITNTKGFSFILFVNSNNISNIESGAVNGYRLRLTDPDGGDGDGLYLEKASGSGWVKIDEVSISPSPNINDGWNILVERESGGTWNWGYANGALGTTVTLTETVVDNDHTTGDYAGMNWFSSATDASDFGFDNFLVDPYTPGLWKTTASTNTWNVTDNWDDGVVPTSTTNVTIPTGATNYPILSSNGSSNNINIQPEAELSINSGQTLNVNGNFTIESDATGTGSFLNEGSLNMITKGTITFRRYIEAWTTQEDGWHLISSPVNSFTVPGSDFVPGDNDDLFYWSEADNLWMNYKVSSFNFNNGHGYLCAYETTGTKEFPGTFNGSDIGFTNLSIGSGNGWHLLGNPFPCALKWNDGNWGLSGIENTAQVYNESAGNYLALSANDIIPASQGFLVKATASTNSITIPVAARTHNNTSFYKSIMEDNPQITLKVTSEETDFYDITQVRMLSGASLNYDPVYDGHKMFGQHTAPQLYSISEDVEALSLNAISTELGQTVQLGFELGLDGAYHLFIDEIMGFDTTSIILIEDQKEDLLFTLEQDTAYDFNALTTDNPDRFLLHFVDVTAVDQVEESSLITAFYKSGNIILINHYDQPKPARVELIDLTGRKLKSWQVQLQAINGIQVDLYPAMYILRVTTDRHYTTKILVQ
ncbi:MAG: T9SS type A sorting domain-containing protein [Bacteroidales bacterium]|nr:T9SS type A sorting domain-containing protein [Bacteroidales bacterium]MCF8343074.1 T9SS type A sorting domain-containing protein [Bacteroidales bacterium]MCF8349969.1 T9SS type A sorting domain-containing protein [Bacteroidales bacterium]MCF8376711.1 T9SS type A sorting domain-containing protein [Bacteroidales bacterium]